jgi:AcrR family transcriptional regulator
MKRVSTPSPAPSAPGKRARTRQQLIEVAATLVREKGFSNVSLEEVAARAGVSRGSIYGNFRDRNDLFVAVAAYRMPRLALKPMPGATLREQMRAIGLAVAEAAHTHRKDAVYWTAYMLHVQSDEKLRRRAEIQAREIRKFIIQEWAKAMPSDPLPMPVETFVKIIGTLAQSLITAHSMSPEDYNDEVMVAAFEALAGSSVTPKRKRKA